MNGLVLFRSYHGNTEEIAGVLAREMRALGHEVTVQDIRRRLPDLAAVDFVMVGAPTRMARVNRKAVSALRRLRKHGIGAKPVAVFDTYGPVPTSEEERERARLFLYPGAAGLLQGAAKKEGLNVYQNTLRCEVTGLKGPLGESEPRRAAAFAAEFAAALRGYRSEKGG